MSSKIRIQQIINSVYSSNTFVISIDDSKDYVWLVDCGDVDSIVELIGDKKVQAVFFTHTHYDHIYGINKLLEYYPDLLLYTNAFGKEALLSPKLNYSRYHQESEDIICISPQNIVVLTDEQSVILNGDIQIIARETPGHDESCITYVLNDNVFSGDSYIPGVKVFANFLHSNKQKAAKSLEIISGIIINKKLYPGHGGVMENNTLNN